MMNAALNDNTFQIKLQHAIYYCCQNHCVCDAHACLPIRIIGLRPTHKEAKSKQYTR